MSHHEAAPFLGRIAGPIRRIALLRASRIGDFLCAVPACRALRQAVPQAEIVMVTLPMLRDLVERSPYLDRFAPFPGFPGLAEQLFEPHAAVEFLGRMQAERFDLAIQMQGSGVYANPFTLLLGARYTAGFLRPDDNPGLLDAALTLPQDMHEIRRVLALTEFLGAPARGEHLEFPLLPDDEARARALLDGLPRPLIGIHAGARDDERRWPLERFVTTARILQQHHGGTIVALGDGDERRAGAALATSLGTHCVNLVGQTSLPVLGAVIARLDLLITNDSGPAHIAYALHQPVVVIFTASSPCLNGPLGSGPYVLLEPRPGAFGLGEQQGKYGHQTIDVSDVMEAAERLLTGAVTMFENTVSHGNHIANFGRVPGVRKIAVLRANALGDLIVILPALDALRAAYPDAKILLLAKEWHAQFLGGRPGPVDRVIVLPSIRGVTIDPDQPDDPAELRRFYAAMRAEGIDLAIQMQGGGRYSNGVINGLGARVTAGLRTPDAPDLDRWIPYVFFQHEVIRYLEVVARVGAEPITLEPQLQTTANDRVCVDGIVAPDNKPLVALHPGAGDTRRRWPADKFARLGDALAKRGARIVLTGTGTEHDIVEAVAGAMTSPAINLCNQLTLGCLAALYQNCALVVSNDTGPLHLARAVGAPTVGIYWCSNLLTFGPLTRSSHRPFISWRMDCPTCGRHCVYDPCAHRPSFVADVPTTDVIDAAIELLRDVTPISACP